MSTANDGGPAMPVAESKPTVIDRIQSYLGNGGLWNPEEMEHDKVRFLIMDCRDELNRVQSVNVKLLDIVKRVVADCEDTYYDPIEACSPEWQAIYADAKAVLAELPAAEGVKG